MPLLNFLLHYRLPSKNFGKTHKKNWREDRFSYKIRFKLSYACYFDFTVIFSRVNNWLFNSTIFYSIWQRKLFPSKKLKKILVLAFSKKGNKKLFSAPLSVFILNGNRSCRPCKLKIILLISRQKNLIFLFVKLN